MDEAMFQFHLLTKRDWALFAVLFLAAASLLGLGLWFLRRFVAV
jgi:hypothetical protein